MSHAQCILFYQSLRPNETKFYSICYSNAFHICSQNSCFLWFPLRMCRAHAMKSDFDVFHLLVITGITFAWVFPIRTFRVSYFLRGQCISTWFFYDVCQQAFLLSPSQYVIHDVCPFRSTTVACRKRSMISICYSYSIRLSIALFLVYILQCLLGNLKSRTLNVQVCKCCDTVVLNTLIHGYCPVWLQVLKLLIISSTELGLLTSK